MNFKACFLAALALASGGSASLAANGSFSFAVLEISDIQRGAGLAIVMRTPSGKTWLYDTGTLTATRGDPRTTHQPTPELISKWRATRRLK